MHPKDVLKKYLQSECCARLDDYLLPLGMLPNIFHVEDSFFVVSLIQVVLANDDSEEVGSLVAERVLP